MLIPLLTVCLGLVIFFASDKARPLGTVTFGVGLYYLLPLLAKMG